jgi:hypothetical protein
MQRIDEYRYELDADDCIVDMDRPWLAFARANGAAELTRDAVLGINVFRYTTGIATCDLYRELFQALRKSLHSITIPFRCDSPDVRRFMELRLVATPHGHLQLIGRLLRREPRPYVPLLDPHVKHDGTWLLICSICRRIETADGNWKEIEDALPDPYGLPRQGLPRLSHGVCPNCAELFKRAVAEAAQK